MRKSANAMDLIGWEPPGCCCFFYLRKAKRTRFAAVLTYAVPYGFAGSAATGALPDELLKNLKKSESGRSRNLVSLLFSPFS